MNLQIGDVVTLTHGMLGCEPGTRGVVYEVYEDFDDSTKRGASIIFENGNYDGFSAKEQDDFLKEEPVMHIPSSITDYKFTNVMKVALDFQNGLWDEIFR